MQPPLVIHVPGGGKQKHGHTPAENARVENVMFSALRPNLFQTRNLLGRQDGWLEQVHNTITKSESITTWLCCRTIKKRSATQPYERAALTACERPFHWPPRPNQYLTAESHVA